MPEPTSKPTQKARVLIVDDEPNALASLSRAFRLAGHEPTVADNANRALDLIKSQSFDAIFSDVVMPGKDGLKFLEELKSLEITTPVIMMSGQAHIEMAVRATRLGAVDFLEKPLSTDKLLLSLENAIRLSRLERENEQLRRRVGRFALVFTGETMRRVMAQVARVAKSETRVCILGETGTGKELVARSLHEQSQRAGGQFITLNCAAVPQELVESELFGHEKGSFTGAASRHAGKFEQADGGTLFLDEIGDMPQPMQAKLLRVLETGEIERVGAERPLSVNVRVVVATHRDLAEDVKQGRFRQDLYHRLYVFPITLPPLRERKEDLPALLEHFAQQIAEVNGWKPLPFSQDAVELLRGYSWPGNVRELRNAVERMILLAHGDVVDAETARMALPNFSAVSMPAVAGESPLAARVQEFERAVILDELKRQHNHITNTAKALGLERSHLYKKCAQLGIDLRSLRE